MNSQKPRPLELLAPARDAETARQAILHGADAVYIGASSHGARSAASNSVDDIRGLVDFAHPYRARIYVTVNTIVYENELQTVERLLSDLYRAGVDAIIVQDMGILRMDIPPIQLHASTQCDISTPEKARFLQDAGFSQLVLARELTLNEIRTVCNTVNVPVECFVHGALCVSYSGRCHASLACGGRSANRGECAQICRMPYTLYDGTGRIVMRDKYLLSMHDFNASRSLADMVNAGVSSFKIEGRLKDVKYVKNTTAYYRQLLDRIIEENPQSYCRSSYGKSDISFTPDLDKSFNRGYTDFCLTNRRNSDLASTLTPKSLGEVIHDTASLNNGDGISWFENGQYTGVRVNRIDNGKIYAAGNKRISHGITLHRTYDVQWEQMLSRDTAERKIAVSMSLDAKGLTLADERGLSARVCFSPTTDIAQKPQNRRGVFEKTGGTIYQLRDFTDSIGETVFIPNSQLADLRRRGLKALDTAAAASYPFRYRSAEDLKSTFPAKRLDYRANVSNSKAASFYKEHGVADIEPAAEALRKSLNGCSVMTSRHCILRQAGLCLRDNKHARPPYSIDNDNNRFRIETDCSRCEMSLIKL